MKILYNPINTRTKEIKFQIMREMINDLLLKGKIEEVFPAKRKEEEGIYAETSNGGKKFWSLKELTYYFMEKNNEKMRMR